MDSLDFAELESDVKEAISYLNKSKALMEKVLKCIEKVQLVKQ